jgi:hypothetical protein
VGGQSRSLTDADRTVQTGLGVTEQLHISEPCRVAHPGQAMDRRRYAQCSASGPSCVPVRVLDIASVLAPGSKSGHGSARGAVRQRHSPGPSHGFSAARTKRGLGIRGNRAPISAFPQTQAPHRRARFASSLAARASVRAASSRSGIASPFPKYISSGVWPLNAECGIRPLCSAT